MLTNKIKTSRVKPITIAMVVTSSIAAFALLHAVISIRPAYLIITAVSLTASIMLGIRASDNNGSEI